MFTIIKYTKLLLITLLNYYLDLNSNNINIYHLQKERCKKHRNVGFNDLKYLSKLKIFTSLKIGVMTL